MFSYRLERGGYLIRTKPNNQVRLTQGEREYLAWLGGRQLVDGASERDRLQASSDR
jgi:hypothetical protein